KRQQNKPKSYDIISHLDMFTEPLVILLALKHIKLECTGGERYTYLYASNMMTSDPVVDSMVLMLRNDKWRKVRSLLTPAFSSGKIKTMIPIMVEESESLIQEILQNGRK
ncbi:cytochrome P450 3A21, partial [Armadillidium vulgare]